MTVAELIEKLKSLDPDLTVVIDGADQIVFADDAYDGSPEIGYRYAIIDGRKAIPEGINLNDPIS